MVLLDIDIEEGRAGWMRMRMTYVDAVNELVELLPQMLDVHLGPERPLTTSQVSRRSVEGAEGRSEVRWVLFLLGLLFSLSRLWTDWRRRRRSRGSRKERQEHEGEPLPW